MAISTGSKGGFEDRAADWNRSCEPPAPQPTSYPTPQRFRIKKVSFSKQHVELITDQTRATLLTCRSIMMPLPISDMGTTSALGFPRLKADGRRRGRPGPCSDSASIPAKPRDSRRCRPQRSLRWGHNADDSRNAETTRLADGPLCCLAPMLKPSAAISTGRLCTQSSDPGHWQPPSRVPAKIGIASLGDPQKAEVHGRAKRFQGDPESVLQHNRPACSPCHLDADPAQAQAAQDTDPTLQQARPT